MLVAGLLMAQPLDSAAKNIESGPVRALARVVTAPIAAVSGLLRIDKFYEWANGATAEVVSTDTTGSTTGTEATTTTAATTTTDPGMVPATTTTTTVAKPAFTAEDPLKVYLAGDSLMIEVGHAFTRRSESLTSVDVFKRNPVGSGFADPSKYDWPKQLTKDVDEFKPDVTVMLIGSNDKVPMTVNGVKVPPFTAEWNAEYVRRVQAGIDITTNTGAIVVWIGMPVMRSDQYSETARTLNAIYEQICEEDPDAYYLDGYELFSDASGKYSAYLIDSDGDNQLVREGDGIHFTPAGGDRVVEAVLEVLREHFTLE
jgi:hypothetical protein